MGRKKTVNGNIAVGWVRVSTEEQQLGPAAQRETISRWCALHSVELIAVFADEVSGASALDKRPGLQNAINALKIHKAGFLVVAKRDRIARDRGLAIELEALVTQEGAKLVSADGTGNGTSDGDFLIRGTVDLFAEYERRLIRARTKAALSVKKSRGERVGTIPFGSSVANDGIRLESNFEEQEIIVKIQDLRESGLSQQQIADSLNVMGCKNRAGGKFRQTQISRILAKSAKNI